MNAENGQPITAVTSVPSEFRKRKRLWIYSSLSLSHADCPYACLSVQTLGYAERMLLDMESRLAVLAKDNRAKKERDLLLSECSAHSVLWIFGLYEILRTLRGARAPHFVALTPLFQKLEALRMPLAKHEAKKIRESAPSHYPTSCWDIENGHVGWSVYDPRLGAMRSLFRTPLASEFLTVAAVEPESLPPFPIGGPLGEFED